MYYRFEENAGSSVAVDATGGMFQSYVASNGTYSSGVQRGVPGLTANGTAIRINAAVDSVAFPELLKVRCARCARPFPLAACPCWHAYAG